MYLNSQSTTYPHAPSLVSGQKPSRAVQLTYMWAASLVTDLALTCSTKQSTDQVCELLRSWSVNYLVKGMLRYRGVSYSRVYRNVHDWQDNCVI